MRTALVVGASSGIGLALCRKLVDDEWTVIGLARRSSPLNHARYRHVVADVRDAGYRDVVSQAIEGHTLDACIYASGIGQLLALPELAAESDVFATNLAGLVATVQVVLPPMLAAGKGHLIGLSSQADRLIDGGAPSYAASKAGMSSYLEGLALACRGKGVAITNLRLGFVDTAMSSPDGPRPFLITAERAAELVERCLRRRPIRYTYPKRMAALLWLVRFVRELRVRFS